uniref:Amidase domain-containing protein n=1 Tax=Ascaris lumbricoides TaxID=6252 RepID=A0A0M3IKN3_ASCLU
MHCLHHISVFSVSHLIVYHSNVPAMKSCFYGFFFCSTARFMLAAFVKTFRPLLLVISEIYFRCVDILFWMINFFAKKNAVPKPTDSLLLISATQAADMIRTRELTSEELVEAYISRIEQINGIINAVVEKNYENARCLAREVDAIFDNLQMGSERYNELVASKPLLGVPFTIKDCIEVDGLRCTIGITSRKDLVAEKDAAVVQRMRSAGAIPLAVTNVPEVCMWWESVNAIHGRSSNPYDTRRITGGSSGGEAALISAAGSVIGLGSDIGGSIRMPSYFNGVFGLKPTSGIVPLTGHLPPTEGFRTEMLRIGPICRYAEDLIIMLKVMAAEESVDLLQLEKPVNLRKMRLFYMEGLKTPYAQSISSECYDALKRAVRYFETKYDLCAIRLDLPFAHYAVEFFLTSIEVPGAPSFAHHMTDLKVPFRIGCLSTIVVAVRYFETKYDLCAIRLDLPFAHYAVEFFLTSIEVPGAPSFAHHMTDLKSELNCLGELVKWCFRRSRHTFPAIITGILDRQSPFNDEQKKVLMSLRDRLNRELRELLQDDAILIFPSFPTTAPYHHQPLLTPLNFAYTALWNTLAMPVVQCPMGLNKRGIPLGVQVVGAPATDRLLIAVAQDLEDGFGGWRPATDS